VAIVTPAGAEVKEIQVGGFVVEKTFTFPASPERVWDGLTGDVSEWWDHTFSGNPHKLYIEAKPGGGFWEIFDESGDGVQHAEVIWAQREKVLKLRGPLGFSGKALDMVHTLTLEPEGPGTRLHLAVHASGEMEEGWPAAVDGVWDHFLGVRLRAWLAGELPAK
jgi:uncharacterized protein YndB with AHSA1/START domain